MPTWEVPMMVGEPGEDQTIIKGSYLFSCFFFLPPVHFMCMFAGGGVDRIQAKTMTTILNCVFGTYEKWLSWIRCGPSLCYSWVKLVT